MQEIPFCYSGSWFNFSPVIAEKTRADDVHLVSHQTGLHPILRLVPVEVGGDRQRQDTAVSGTPALLTWRHPRGVISLAYESHDTVRVTGTGLDLFVTAANVSLTPFSGPYFFQDPVDGAYVYTLYESGRRYRITVIAGRLAGVTGGQALGVTDRGVVCAGDGGRWEIAIEEYETARVPYRAENLVRRGPPQGRGRVRLVCRRRRTVARRVDTGRRSRRIRPVVGDRPTRRVPRPPRRSHVQTLDEQGVELGITASTRSLSRRDGRTWPGTSSRPRSTTRTPAVRCPTL